MPGAPPEGAFENSRADAPLTNALPNYESTGSAVAQAGGLSNQQAPSWVADITSGPGGPISPDAGTLSLGSSAGQPVLVDSSGRPVDLPKPVSTPVIAPRQPAAQYQQAWAEFVHLAQQHGFWDAIRPFAEANPELMVEFYQQHGLPKVSELATLLRMGWKIGVGDVPDTPGFRIDADSRTITLDVRDAAGFRTPAAQAPLLARALSSVDLTLWDLIKAFEKQFFDGFQADDPRYGQILNGLVGTMLSRITDWSDLSKTWSTSSATCSSTWSTRWRT